VVSDTRYSMIVVDRPVDGGGGGVTVVGGRYVVGRGTNVVVVGTVGIEVVGFRRASAGGGPSGCKPPSFWGCRGSTRIRGSGAGFAGLGPPTARPPRNPPAKAAASSAAATNTAAARPPDTP